MSTTLEISEARSKLHMMTEWLADAGERVATITRHGKPVFVIVDPDYFDSLIETIEVLADPEAMAALQASAEDLAAGRVYPVDDVIKEFQ